MKKKFLWIILTLVFITGCRSLDIEDSESRERTAYRYYKKWDIDGLKEIREYTFKSSGETGEWNLYNNLINTREKQLSDLEEILNQVKKEGKINQTETLENHLKDKYRNNKLLEGLQDVNLSYVNIYFSKLKVEDGKIENIVALNYSEETSYLNLEYEFLEKDKKWIIKSFDERRGGQ